MSTLSLGLLPPLGGGLSRLAASGQVGRFIDLYLRRYASAFEEVLYFSDGSEELARHTTDPAVLARVRVVPGAGRAPYRVGLAGRWAQALRRCRVVRVFQLTGALPAVLARWRWNIPFAVTYGYDYARAAGLERRRGRALALLVLERLTLRAASAVLAPTPALVEQARRRGAGARVHLVPNAVDTARFRPRRFPEAATIIFVGRLEPQKNLRLLLEAAARITPSPRLVLVGDGSQRESLARTAGALDLSLELRGVVPYEHIPAALGEGSVFALPSRWEGHPKALLEAMSCGLACVGTHVSGVRDVLRAEETGLLALGEPAAFAAALHRALADRQLAQRLGLAARAWVEANCSAASIMPRETALLLGLPTEETPPRSFPP
jgi:glycosyltransferase involved in cell wall biosynthesis